MTHDGLRGGGCRSHALTRRSTGLRAVASLLFAWASVTPLAGEAQALTLDDALGAALGAHPSLMAANAHVTSASEAGDAARAARLPGAAITATLTRFQEPMVVAPFHSLDFSSPPTFDRTLVQGQLAAAYTLFDGGERSSRIAAADAAHAGSLSARDAAEMELLHQVVSAYVDVLSARVVRDAAEAQALSLTSELARARRHFEAGSAPEVEILRVSATLEGARAQEVGARAAVGLAERALARLMGAEPGSVTGRPLGDITARPGVPGAEAPRSPLVAQARHSVTAAEARLSGERAGRLPDIRAGAGLLDFGTVSTSHVLEWQAGIEVSWPVFTGGARNAAVREAEAAVALASARLEVTELEVAQATDAASTAIVEADARAQALDAAVLQWEEVARIESLALEAGSGTQSDMLGAQAGLFHARAGSARARYDAVLARVALARARGDLDREWIANALEVSR